MSLDGVAGNIGKVGKWRNVGDGLTPGGQLVQRYENAANENHRKFHH